MSAYAPIAAPCAWLGRDMIRSSRWIRDLQAADIAELDAALAAVERRKLAWHEIKREDFPLPGLAPLLSDIGEELENGCGMVKLRGLPVERYSEDRLRTLYWGLGSNLGTPVFQNRRGELMRLIRDEGGDVGKRYGQIERVRMADGKPFLSSYARTLTNGALRFHTDRTDAVALLCVRQAAKGGVSTICSSVSVMNEMLKRRPDLAAAAVRALLPQPSRRGGGDRRGRLRAAGVRRPRRPLHQPLLAHLHRGGTDGGRRAQAHRAPEGSARHALGARQGARPRDDPRPRRPARRHRANRGPVASDTDGQSPRCPGRPAPLVPAPAARHLVRH